MIDNDRDVAKRLGPSSPSQPAFSNREAGPACSATIVSPSSLGSPPPVVVSHPPPSRKRPITLLDFWPPPTGKTRRPLPPSTCGHPAPRACRRKSTDSPAATRPSKLSRPPDGPVTSPSSHHSPTPPSPDDVSFVGPAAPRALQAVSPSGDVRLTLRRYSVGDSLASPDILLRLDLRIHPRDLYAIPSDGHCGYHTLTVLTHPLYPLPPPRLTGSRSTTSSSSASKIWLTPIFVQQLRQVFSIHPPDFSPGHTGSTPRGSAASRISLRSAASRYMTGRTVPSAPGTTVPPFRLLPHSWNIPSWTSSVWRTAAG